MLIKKKSSIFALTLTASLLPLKQITPALALLFIFIPKRVKINEFFQALTLVTLFLFSFAASDDRALINFLTSVTLLFAFLFFILFKKSIVKSIDSNELILIINIFIWGLLLNGLIGLVQYLIFRNDDAAIGFYGRSGLQTHGLAIMYFMAALYLIAKPFSFRNSLKIAALLTFMITCFYGAGIFAAFIALIFTAVLSAKNKSRALLIVVSGLSVAGLLAWVLSPKTIIYNYNILLKFMEGISTLVLYGTVDTQGMPRKMIAWVTYFDILINSPERILLGFGGGTFNSRAAFLLNGDYSSLDFLPHSVTVLHSIYMLPLWSTETAAIAFNDGTMNQPFSSALAIVSEYGILAFLFIIKLYLGTYKFFHNHLKETESRSLFALTTLFIFFALLCVFDNFLEYPGIVIPFIVFSLAIHIQVAESIIKCNTQLVRYRDGQALRTTDQ